jgi:hypothetical protein
MDVLLTEHDTDRPTSHPRPSRGAVARSAIAKYRSLMTISCAVERVDCDVMVLPLAITEVIPRRVANVFQGAVSNGHTRCCVK